MISLDQQIAEVNREIAMRRRVYPRFVASGKMTQEQADQRIAAMHAVHETLTRLRDEQRAKTAPGLF